MKLSEFKTTPKLVAIQATSEEILEKYQEPLDFFITSPLPMEEYATLGGLNQTQFLRKMAKNEDGTPILGDNETLPQPILTAVVSAIWLELGKLPEKS